MSSSNKPSLQIVSTKDGSQTILNTELGSTYHSRHGALTESQHVFIDKGLRKQIEDGVTNITLLEMGFGTGLNALLTAIEAKKLNIRINYHALELFPVPEEVWKEYELPEELSGNRDLYDAIQLAEWDKEVIINPNFSVTKDARSVWKAVLLVKSIRSFNHLLLQRICAQKHDWRRV
jgi:tRNA U34 5-methylaminomethyl-2-thiouridine-forming methyltransferase MnmC